MTEELSELIIKRICECGWKAYLCGGAIRDSFLDREPLDYDIVTDALPEELKKIFPDRKVKSFGASFLVTSIDGIDVSTYRSDKNFGPGRFNCVTKACQTLDEDLARRDLTINAFAVCPYTGEIVDKFGGLQDLNNKLVRFVGDPDKRIYEDPIRMIRACRFTCLIEGTLVRESFESIVNNKDKIKTVSPERVQIELMKVMKYRKPSIFFDVLHDTGLLKILIPELDVMYGHTGGKYHGETLDIHFKLTGDYLSPKKPVLRLAGYLHDIGKVPSFDGTNFIDHEKIGAEMASIILSRYKFTTKDKIKIKNLIRLHMRSINDIKTDKSVRKLLKALNDNNLTFKEWFKLRVADKKANLKKESSFYPKEKIKYLSLAIYKSKTLSKEAGLKITDLKINGNDVMKTLQIPPGKLVGVALKNLLDLVIENPEHNDRDKLIELLLILKSELKI